MENTARDFFEAFEPRLDFSMSDPGNLYMEKLCEVMQQRILGQEKEFRMVFNGADMYDKGDVAFDDDYITRYYEDGNCVYSDLLTEGCSLLGSVSDPLYLRWTAPDNEEEAKAFINSHTVNEVAQLYLPCLERWELETLPSLCRELYVNAASDPMFEETDIGFFIMKSRLIGEYISCDRIPDGMRKKADRYLRVVEDPFDRGYFWSGVSKGTWINAVLFGCPDCYEWVSWQLVTVAWFPAIVLLKEEIQRLDSMFGFLSSNG